mgnify:CR=1 FL=1
MTTGCRRFTRVGRCCTTHSDNPTLPPEKPSQPDDKQKGLTNHP